ncbi:enoyl-CoA hydratase/isomerase family protein [Phenylobacterium sp.]|jgi:enoyl-CoA hydratase/carnithine racemase|uniref:enoyl-CoA hydratase/isomerase family protein n=1 Tax=Phenylobacterium sp. TaxID=1871053 RepID=UPI002F409C08
MKSSYGDTVSVALDGRHVAIVVIDAPPHNFVSVDMVRHLADALDALDGENDCRAIVLAATGKAFSAGADLASTTGVAGSGMGGIGSLYEQAVRLFAARTPVVAAIQGAAVGAGLGLALAADFRVASPDARFAANFVKLGFHPGFGLTVTLPRLIGAQRAELMFLTGRRIKPEQALAWGMVDELAPREALMDAARALAREIAENAPLAVTATRKTLRGELAAAVRAQTAIEFEQQSILRVTDDYAEGVKAVNERRTGNFAGR